MKTMTSDQVFAECLQVSDSFTDVTLPESDGNEETVNFGTHDSGLAIFRKDFRKFMKINYN